MARKPATKTGKAPIKNKGGRPSKYSEKLIEDICARLSRGEPLAAICRDDGMPHHTTVWDWEKARANVSLAIARAREAGEEWLAAECLEIADDSRNDWTDAKAAAGDERAINSRENGEVIQRSKLRIETRLKLLAKFNPKRWGDKLQHSSDPDNPLPAPQWIVQPVAPAPRKDSDA